MKENIILDNTFSFGVRIVKLYQFLKERKQFELGSQILRSRTSIGANVEEAEGAISKRSFTAKMNVAFEESRETRYWLRLLDAGGILDKKQFESLFNDCDEIVKILYAILKTSREN